MAHQVPPAIGMIGFQTITNTVYEVLRNHIIDQTFTPGQQLQVIELAERFGVSRTPVKDALGTLSAEGLVKIIPRRGTFVSDMGPTDIAETYQVRQALELAAGESLVASLTPEKLDRLKQALRELELAANSDDIEQHIQKNFAFHDLFVELAGNRKLLKMYRSLKAPIQIARIHYRSPNWKKRLGHERREHRAIVVALEENDAAALAFAIIAHLSRARESLVADMKTSER